jgi:hypothetical protein
MVLLGFGSAFLGFGSGFLRISDNCMKQSISVTKVIRIQGLYNCNFALFYGYGNYLDKRISS